MMFRDTRTGSTLEPRSEFVAQQMAKDPALVPVREGPKRKRTTRKPKPTEV